jgi:hypothetical protein
MESAMLSVDASAKAEAAATATANAAGGGGDGSGKIASVNHYLPCLCYRTLTPLFIPFFFTSRHLTLHHFILPGMKRERSVRESGKGKRGKSCNALSQLMLNGNTMVSASMRARLTECSLASGVVVTDAINANAIAIAIVGKSEGIASASAIGGETSTDGDGDGDGDGDASAGGSGAAAGGVQSL